MIYGKIYQIVADHTTDTYIGCSGQKYISQRMACHRQNAKTNIGNYGDLFSDINNNPPRIEILEECEFENFDMLRKREREIMENTENTVNLKCAYLSPEEKEINRKLIVKKYQNSEKGKLAVNKSTHNQKVKKLNEKLVNAQEKNNFSAEEIADIIYMLEILRNKIIS